MKAPADARTRWLRLPIEFGLAGLRADLDLASAWHWRQHYNDGAHRGSWTSIALRSASGDAGDIAARGDAGFTDTPLLAQCAAFRDALAAFACEKQAVRLMALGPGAEIAPHRDHGGAIEDGLARLHIPILTDPAVVFTIDGEDVHFGAGACWYMNADCVHAVRNRSAQARVHLVLDCVPNDWLRALFARSGWTPPRPRKYQDPNINDDNAGAVVARLRASGLPAALVLADSIARLQFESDKK